jgi:hypothetical protein
MAVVFPVASPQTQLVSDEQVTVLSSPADGIASLAGAAGRDFRFRMEETAIRYGGQLRICSMSWLQMTQGQPPGWELGVET